MAFLNIIPTSMIDGVVYALATPLTSVEADLWNNLGPDPFPVTFGQYVVAVVQFTPQGGPISLNAFVAMQTDMGDGNWVDAAIVSTTERQSPSTYVLCAGATLTGASITMVQQTRKLSQMPNASTDNISPLMGRVRFTGKSILTGFSSNSPLGPWNVTATITYKVLGPN